LALIKALILSLVTIILFLLNPWIFK
jgi:hypothetical protein